MIKGLVKAGLVYGFVIWVAACGTQITPDQDVKVRGGVESFHNNIAIFYSQDGRCTSTFINQEPPVMLTARHCVERSWKDNNAPVPEGHRAHVVFENGGELERLEVTDYFYPVKKFYQIGVLIIPNDFALLKLESAPKSDLDTYPLASRKPRLGEPLRVVGYGQSDCLAPLKKGKEQRAVQREKEYNFGINFNVCPGDSGGPHFNEAGELIMVTSAVGLLGESHVKVANHLDTIKDVISTW